MPTQLDEIDASIRDLEASLADAHPDMRGLLEQQLVALRKGREQLAEALASYEQSKPARPQLSPELRELFTPDPVIVPMTWIADDVHATQVGDADMRGPAGTVVQRDDEVIRCIIPGSLGSLPVPEGLTLTFNQSGRLSSQRFYERGCLRWSIDYHVVGGRESVGYWVDRERFDHTEHGQHTRWAPNGAIIAQSYWEAGKRHGWTKLWEDDGYPIGATLYEHGERREERLPDGSRRD